jgi:death on curing protein
MSTTQKISYLDLEDFIDIVSTIQEQKHLFYFEDIPPFETRYYGILESVIEQIKGVCFGVELYPDLYSKAAWLFYSLIKNHPFQNGNKRVAVIALVVFLTQNCPVALECRITKSEMQTELYELAVHVAQSNAQDKDTIFLEIKERVEKIAQFMNPQKSKWFWFI